MSDTSYLGVSGLTAHTLQALKTKAKDKNRSVAAEACEALESHLGARCDLRWDYAWSIRQRALALLELSKIHE